MRNLFATLVAAVLLANASLTSCAATINTSMVKMTGGLLGSETLFDFPTGSGHHTSYLLFDVDAPIETGNVPNRVRLVNQTLDIQIDWFIAEQGQEFTAASILNGDFTKLPFTGPLTPFASMPKYLAFHVSPIPQLYGNEMFGWLEIGSDFFWITYLRAQATVINGKGIVIGTTKLVPEPTSLVITAIAAGAIGIVGRRRMDYSSKAVKAA